MSKRAASNFASDLQHDLLVWFDIYARTLPFRTLPWQTDDINQRVYLIWLSEIMLQQTQIATVIPYYLRFLEAFPTLEKLANASLDDVLHLWQGLGYYSRARNLHKCAQAVVNEYAGTWPTNATDLQKLPGIGPYTAAIIASLAFDESATVMDGNIERVMSRLFTVETPLPTAKPELKQLAAKLTPTQRPGDHAAALMDLGATICTPKNPRCGACPAQKYCGAFKAGNPAEYPKRLPKQKRPEKTGSVYILQNSRGEIYLQQRPDSGLLASLYELPSEGWERSDSVSLVPFSFRLNSASNRGKIRHVFTHFSLTLNVFLICEKSFDSVGAQWFSLDRLPPLPTLMKKVLSRLSE